MKVTAIVLAGGKGTRMESETPKVLHQIGDKPLISHTLSTLEKLNLEKIIVVVGHKADEVKSKIGPNLDYVLQEEPKGTGHAVMAALPKIPNDSEVVMVINGDDSAFYKVETLQNLIDKHNKSGSKVTFLTSYQEYSDVSGRIIRDEQGKISAIKPNSQLTPEQLENHKEYVCGVYIFNKDYLAENLPKLETNSSGEFPLTDLIIKNLGSDLLNEVKLEDPSEWRSVNTQEELRLANELWKKLND